MVIFNNYEGVHTMPSFKFLYMKKIFFLLLFVGSQAFAQNIEVTYFENPIVDKSELEKVPEFARQIFLPNKFSYTLTYREGVSLYQNDDFLSLFAGDDTVYEKEDAVIDGTSTTFKGKVVYDENTFKSKEKLYYKDVINNEVYYTEMGYQIIDKPLNWEWEITDETSTIAGYTCRKAVSGFMGRTFEAWYAEDIAINAGPDKFDGLPGLILYVRTKGMEIVAQSIKNSDTLATLEKPVFEGKVYTFDELYNQPRQSIPSQSTEKNSHTHIFKTN